MCLEAREALELAVPSSSSDTDRDRSPSPPAVGKYENASVRPRAGHPESAAPGSTHGEGQECASAICRGPVTPAPGGSAQLLLHREGCTVGNGSSPAWDARTIHVLRSRGQHDSRRARRTAGAAGDEGRERPNSAMKAGKCPPTNPTAVLRGHLRPPGRATAGNKLLRNASFLLASARPSAGAFACFWAKPPGTSLRGANQRGPQPSNAGGAAGENGSIWTSSDRLRALCSTQRRCAGAQRSRVVRLPELATAVGRRRATPI